MQNRPGLFTGSGFPMRFADENGSLIDVYQAATQLTDESGIDIPAHIKALLDGALGSDGYYGVFTANMHTDIPVHEGARAIVNEAQSRGVPVVSAVQMATWLDGRNGSSFGGLSFAGGQLRFTVHAANGSRGLRAMIPSSAGGRALVSLTRGGQPVSLTARTVKGIAYAMFDAAAGDYVAQYGPDQQPPETTIGAVTVAGSAATVTFGSDDRSAHFDCRLDAGAFAACSSPATFAGLAVGAHTVRVRAIDPAGNVDPTPATADFTIAGTQPGGGGSQSGGGSQPGGGSTPPGGNGSGSSADHTAPRIAVTRGSVKVSRTGNVTLRVTCPRGEVRCSIDLQLRRKGQRLARKTVTVAGGKTVRVTLRLTHSARRQLTRSGALNVDAVAAARDAAGNRATTRTHIRLIAPRRR